MKFLILCIAITACANGIPTSQQATLHPSSTSSTKAKPAQVKDQQALPVRSTTPASPTATSYVP